MQLFRERIAERAEALIAAMPNQVSNGGNWHLPAEDISVATYFTDTDGWVRSYSKACVSLCGRVPLVGVDRWCVTWRLYDRQGGYLPHDKCPMAVAIRQKRPIRGIEAIVERPDGSRIPMLPFPTPLFDDAGSIVGAVNILVDLSNGAEMERLESQAARCRRLACSIDDTPTAEALRRLAEDFDARADALIGLA